MASHWPKLAQRQTGGAAPRSALLFPRSPSLRTPPEPTAWRGAPCLSSPHRANPGYLRFSWADTGCLLSLLSHRHHPGSQHGAGNPVAQHLLEGGLRTPGLSSVLLLLGAISGGCNGCCGRRVLGCPGCCGGPQPRVLVPSDTQQGMGAPLCSQARWEVRPAQRVQTHSHTGDL